MITLDDFFAFEPGILFSNIGVAPYPILNYENPSISKMLKTNYNTAKLFIRLTHENCKHIPINQV